MSSIAGLRGNRVLSGYGVTKAANAQIARNLAVQWGPSGVRANAISPGVIATEFARRSPTMPTPPRARLREDAARPVRHARRGRGGGGVARLARRARS